MMKKIKVQEALGYGSFHLVVLGAPAWLVLDRFDLPGMAQGLALLWVLGLATARFVIGLLPAWARVLSLAAECPATQLAVIETRTVTGGVALIGAIACLSTEPLKAAATSYQSAIVVLVVMAAVYLFLCRTVAQDASSCLREAVDGGADARRPSVHPSRAWAEASFGMMAMVAGLLAFAVW